MPAPHADGMEAVLRNIREKLIARGGKAPGRRRAGGLPAVGAGLDSSLVCAIAARKLDRPIRTFAIGMDTDAIDLKYARQTAEYLGSEHHEVIITRDDVIQSLEEVVRILGTWDITTVRGPAWGCTCCARPSTGTPDVRVLLTGEISDELFGYKYTDYAPTADAFQQESQKRVAGAVYVRRAPGRPVHLGQQHRGPRPLWRFGLCPVRHGHRPRDEGEPLRQGQVPAAQSL